MTRFRSVLVWSACALLAAGFATAVFAEQAKLDVSVSHPLLLEEGKQTVYVKVGLTGFELKEQADRTPVNLSVVLDRSGSMGGSKIEQAKEAAIFALDRLGKNDILSIVVYDDRIDVLLPATKLTDKEAVRKLIRQIDARGSTALYGGVQKGAEELRKFLDKNRVNRIVLLSDGLANVGPDTPAALEELGKGLAGENISVSTMGLGLGYNEDLMLRLAKSGEGNHYFIENSGDLAGFFDCEFESAMMVVAQDADFKVRFGDGIRPVRALNRQVDIEGQSATFSIPQIYADHEKYVIFEVEVKPHSGAKEQQVASAEVSYTNIVTKTTDRLNSSASVRFTGSSEMVESKINKKVLEEAVLLIANLQNEMATRLRDEGDIKGAEKLLKKNAAYINESRDRYALPAARLDSAADMNLRQSERLSEDEWAANRKSMSAAQGGFGGQQYTPSQK